MSRPSEPVARCAGALLAAGLTLLLVFAPPARAQGTDAADAAVESYLDAHGLDAALAAQLRDRLGRTPAAERAPIAERLAALYATLIESAGDPADQKRWQTRARELLSMIPEGASASLRLNLERARYAQAERDLERARLLLADPSARAEALDALGEIAPVFKSIAHAAHQRVLAIRQQEESNRPYDAQLLARALRTARHDRSLGYYLAGWSNVYLAEFANAPARAADALPQLGWLLGAEWNEPPRLDKVPPKSLRFEHVARAAIGVAIAHAMLGDENAANAWLDLVESSELVPASVRSQVPARRVTVLARFGRWSQINREVNRARHTSGRETPLEPALARLVVVLALGTDDARQPRIREALARAAVADLVARQELAQVVDLAGRFGTVAIAEGGFIGGYVRGLLAYERARDAHHSASADVDSPTGDPALAQQYLGAADLLRAALRDADASNHPHARASAATLAGTALYLASAVDPGALTSAIDWLRRASSWRTDPARAADALWLAHRAARRLSGAEASRVAGAIADEFFARFPDDPRSGVLRVERAAEGALSKEDAVEILLDTSRDSPAFESAQRRAARLLYDLYRAAPPDRRDWSALRYAAVAEPLLAIDRARAGDPLAAERAMVRARRLLDALLSVQNPDADRAAAALAAVDALVASGAAEPPPAGETLLRRLQIALARGDESAALAQADALRQLAHSDHSAQRFIEFADRAMFDAATRAWREASAAQVDSPTIQALARSVVARGAVVLGRLGGRASIEERALPVQAIIAEAATDLWRATGDDDALELAYSRHRLLLRAHPNDRGALRRLADLAEARGDIDTALHCWRTLASGLEPNTNAWFEARVRLIELLADSDPGRAAEALRQHVALRPDLGPEPWRTRLIALADRLGVPIPPRDGGPSP